MLSEWQSAVLILIPDSFIFGNYFFGRQANRANVKSVTNILWKFGSLLDQSDPIQETDYNAMITIHRQSALSTLLISMSRSFLGAWTLAVSSSWLLAGHDSLPHLDLNLKICCFKLLHGYFYHFYQHVLQVFAATCRATWEVGNGHEMGLLLQMFVQTGRIVWPSSNPLAKRKRFSLAALKRNQVVDSTAGFVDLSLDLSAC